MDNAQKTLENQDTYQHPQDNLGITQSSGLDGQDGGNDYWRGTATYTKTFPKPELGEGERVFIEFNGVAMTADVTLNGVMLAHHEGGYSTFRTDMTDALAEENVLTVTVDNSANDRVYPQKADFTFYGGLYRDVNLIVVPEQHFELLKKGTPGIKVTPVVDIKKKRAVVTVETWHNGGEVEITVNGENCIDDGISVLCYCHWSLLDNFEWQKGYSMTFGLIAVDRATQERTPKPSLAYLGGYTK